MEKTTVILWVILIVVRTANAGFAGPVGIFLIRNFKTNLTKALGLAFIGIAVRNTIDVSVIFYLLYLNHPIATGVQIAQISSGICQTLCLLPSALMIFGFLNPEDKSLS